MAAQGTLTPLNTGNGQALTTESRALIVPASPIPQQLLLDFGYSTDETPGAGSFLDSFTISIQDLDHLFTTIFSTIDAGGLVVAPASPGTVVVDPADVRVLQIPYPSLQPILASQFAYRFAASIPPEFMGKEINIFFDLFDNLDPAASQAWFENVRITPVPEPSLYPIFIPAVFVFGKRFAGRKE